MNARRAVALAGGALLGSAALLGVAAARPRAVGARPDEPAGDLVGTIEGDAIAVQGPMRVEVVRGQVRMTLRSGSDVRVKAGQARIELVEGGAISICGPAHLSVLKSGGSLTLALDSGTVHLRVEREPAVVVYTAQIQAKPMAIGDGAEEALVGIDAAGAMCIHAISGAMRVEQQLTGQSVIVPQSADIHFVNARFESMRTNASACHCELELTKTVPAEKPPEVNLVATAEEARRAAPRPATVKPVVPAEPPQVREEPVYQVFMPPLEYDVSAKVQPEPDAKFILLVRRARVRSTLIFQGRVEGEAIEAAAKQVASAAPPSAPPAASQKVGNDSVITRVRNFLRRIWNSAS